MAVSKVPRATAEHLLNVIKVLLEETLGVLMHERPEWNLDADGAK